MVNKKLEVPIINTNKVRNRRYSNLFSNYFNNAIARNLSFMISGLVMIVIGFFNYDSHISFLACLGMVFIVISVYMLENDVRRYELKREILDKKNFESVENTIEDEKIDIVL